MAIVDAEYRNTAIPSIHRGNPLIESLPPIPSDLEILTTMTSRPELNRDDALQLQPHVRMYELDLLREVFIPHPVSIDYVRQIDMIIRSVYVARNPMLSAYQKYIYDIQSMVQKQGAHAETTAAMMTLKGSSGLGKTRMTRVALAMYPQVIRHTEYQGHKMAELQIVWLRVEAPIGGALRGFVFSLFEAIDMALGLTGTKNAYGSRSRPKASYDELIREFVQIAASHHLGILHIDDIQRIAETSTDREYVMQTIIRLANVAGFAVLFTGTEDISKVIKAMKGKAKSSRQSLPQTFEVARRIVSEGYFEIIRAYSAEDEFFQKFVREIFKYQWLEEPLLIDEKLSGALWAMSAGIPSVLLLLHRLAQREALSECSLKLLKTHYIQAHDKYLGPLIPLLAAIRQGKTLSIYENREFEKFLRETEDIA